MGINVTGIDPKVATVAVEGKNYDVKFDDGAYTEFSVEYGPKDHYGRRRRFVASTLRELEAQLNNWRGEEAKKRERAKALKAAESEPVPATLLLRGSLVDVGVRGVDQRSGKLLIVLPDGSRDSVARGALFRPLDREEREGLNAAREAYIEAGKRVRAVEGVNDAYSIVSDLDISVEATYDTDLHEWYTTYDGELLHARSTNELGDLIEERVLRETYPYLIDGNGKILCANDHPEYAWRHSRMFKTREQAEEFLRLGKDEALLKRVYDGLQDTYRFDASIFDDDEESK